MLREQIGDRREQDGGLDVTQLGPRPKTRATGGPVPSPPHILTYAFAGSSTSRGLQVQWKEDTVRNAISLGGDVDTMGRNCGSVLGVPNEIEFKKE